MSAPFSCTGKQVLLNGKHYADACDEIAAKCIADELNAARDYDALHKAAHDYFYAASERVARLTAGPLKEQLARKRPSEPARAA